MNPWRLSLLGFALASTANAQTDNDTAVRFSTRSRFQVVNGDTVKFGPQLVHLFGIDAPQKGQTCNGGKWLPGPLSTKELRTTSDHVADGSFSNTDSKGRFWR